jgi:hypothetical protein
MNARSEPQIGAGVWPIAVIVTVEVLTRASRRWTWFWNTVRVRGAIGDELDDRCADRVIAASSINPQPQSAVSASQVAGENRGSGE